MSTNGRGRDRAEMMQQKWEREDERREEERQEKKEQMALQQAFNADGDLSRGFIEAIVSKEDLEIGAPEAAEAQGDVVHEATVAKLQNLLSRDWVLGNLTHAQEHDARNKAEVIKLKILDMHPPEESHVQGHYRAFLMGDDSERLTSLSPQDRLLIDELIETLKTRFGRGREGFERQQQNTSINRAETDDEQSSNSDSGWGLF